MFNFILGIKRFVRNAITTDKESTIRNIVKLGTDMVGIKKELGFIYICSDGRRSASEEDAVTHDYLLVKDRYQKVIEESR